MVRSDGGQLYTIEGLAAALIMVITAYLVVNATSVYTAGDTHISDMQLETLGTDALTMMATPKNMNEDADNDNTLRSILENDYSPTPMDTAFRTEFLKHIEAGGINPARSVQYVAYYTCRDVSSGSVNPTWFSSAGRDLTGTEHPVRVTKWVIMKDSLMGCSNGGNDRAVLVEVLIWLD
jgi:hypothetical protein